MIDDFLSLDDVERLPPLVDVATAARALAISRSLAYELIRTGQFPVPVLRLSARNLRVKSSDLRALLGADPATSDALPA